MMKPENEQTDPFNAMLHVAPGDRVLILRIPGVNLEMETVREMLETAGAGPEKGLHLCHGADAPETYAYIVWQADQAAGALVGEQAARRHPDAEAVVMEVVQVLNGASAGSAAQWHYIVETDVAAPAEDDFNAWYAQEHLPGLASVPGTVRAVRLHEAQASPRYHALYLLETRETFGSPPWLAVRATGWSSRVRPHFQNTKRTMFAIATNKGN